MKSTCLAGAVLALGIAGASIADTPPTEVGSELAAPGKLRVAVAIGNSPSAFWATRDNATGQPRGVPVVLAQDLARRLGLALELVPFDSSIALTNAAAAGAWDVAFVPADVERAKLLDFTPPYYLYETAFVASAGSSLRRVDQLDRAGVRIGARAGTTTMQNVARGLRKAEVVPFGTRDELIRALGARKVDAVATGAGSAQAIAANVRGSRILEGDFRSFGIAAAVPKNHPATLAYLREFIEAAKNAGTVQKAVEAEGVRSGIVAPPAARD